METERQKKKKSGVTRRWFRSTLSVVLIVYLVMAFFIFLMIRNYYYDAVEKKLDSQFTSSVSNFFSMKDNSSERTFEDIAQDYIRNYNQKDQIEVWVIDQDGNVIESSSGFAIPHQTIPDYNAALNSPTLSASYTGKDAEGEPIKSKTFIINSNNGKTDRCAVRYIISMSEVHKQLWLIVAVIVLLYIILILLVLISGIYFIDSIIKPLDQMNTVTRRIAEGDLNARMEPQEYNDEISELAENINYMAEEVGSTDKMKNDFISTISHEMKTPLTAIKGWAETLQAMDGSDPSLTKRGLEVIVDETTRLTGVVNDLLDLSKLASGRLTLKYEKIDYLAELDQTIYMFKDRSMREGIELVYNVPNVPAPAEGDPDRIDQVFVNILDNAFKYNKQGGKVTVYAELIPPEEGASKAKLRIYVEDTGCGIAKEELPRIRRKFYKSNISVSGSGIGLAVVDEIVKMHNGTMDIQSELNVGTCVILTFPVDYVRIENPIPPEVQEGADSLSDEAIQKEDQS